MSSQLERYLRDVAVELHELPEQEREEQIEEIRAHLLAYAEKQRAAGAGDDKAVQAAITQFGRPADVGRRIARARMRGKAYQIGLIVTAVLAVAGGVGVSIGFGPGFGNRALLMALATIVEMLLIGCFFGLLLKKPAIKWIAIFYTMMSAIGFITAASINPYWAYGHVYVVHNHVLFVPRTNDPWPILAVSVLSTSSRVLFATLGAWLGARMADKLIRRRGAAKTA